MLYTGIDLAQRHSAALSLSHDLEVLYESTIDTGQAEKQEHPWVRLETYRNWWEYDIWKFVSDVAPVEHAFAVEEPYPHAVNVAPSFRIQGAILAEMQRCKISENQVRIHKSKPWQDYFGYTKKEFGNSKAWAEIMCDGFGYVPGCTWDKKTKAKQREDLRDAYLIARWLKETF